MTRATFSYKALGRHLRQLRQDAGISQPDLAERLGIGSGTARQYERAARRPSLDVVFAWSSACGRPLTLVWAEPVAQRPAVTDTDPTHDLTRLYEVQP